jgi:hypothetical protein
MIAVALLSLVVVIYAGANAVQRNIQTNTVHRSNSHNAAIYKTQELLKPANLDQLIKKIPAGQTAIGSLWPKPMLSGFSDELDLRGKVVAPGKGEFVRQWAAVKDFPNPGQTTVYVSIKDRHSTDPARVYSKVRGEAKDQVK